MKLCNFGLIRVRGVVPYDVSRPLCVVGVGAVKIPKIVPAASLGLGEGLETCRQVSPGGMGSHGP